MLIRDQAAALSHEVTPEGFLHLRARIGRAGLHDYKASELGQPAGFGPEDHIRVYRPPEEVFDPASMASFAGKPITDEHPPAMVDASNWRRFAVGHSGAGVARDGDHLTTDLFIADAAAAERARKGAALSNGYQADFIFKPGMTPAGEPYDAVQRNIHGNHIALVDAGRCGDSCRTDAQPTGDCACDSSQEPIVDTSSLDAIVEERTGVIETARRLLGPSFAPAGRSTPQIRRLVVAGRLGDAAAADRSDAYVTAAFDTLAALHKPANALAAHLALGLTAGAPSRMTALAARDRYLSHAWKGAPLYGDL